MLPKIVFVKELKDHEDEIYLAAGRSIEEVAQEDLNKEETVGTYVLKEKRRLVKQVRVVSTGAILFFLSATAEAAIGEMDISWTNPSPDTAQGIAIERAVGASGVPGTFTEIVRTGPGVQLYVDRDPALVHNTQYCYRVRGFNAGGMSPYAIDGGTATFACALFQASPPAARSNLGVK